MADGEGVSSGLSYSVLEEDTHQPSYGPSAFFTSSSPGNRTVLRGCLRASVPHLLIVVVYIVYLLIGGGIFLAIHKAVELPNLVNTTAESARLEELKLEIDEAVKTCSQTVKEFDLPETWDTFTSQCGSWYADDQFRHELSYMRSVLFSLTTITTIGYGDYEPTTTVGKVATVFYALVGIPLSLIFLVDIGNLLASVVDSLVSKCRCCKRGSSSRSAGIYKGSLGPRYDEDNTRGEYWQDTAWGRRDVPVFVVVVIWLVYVLLAGLLITVVEGWSYGEGLFFTVTSMTTIGFGDLVAIWYHSHIPSFFACLVHILSTLSVMSMCVILMLPKILKLNSKINAKIIF